MLRRHASIVGRDGSQPTGKVLVDPDRRPPEDTGASPFPSAGDALRARCWGARGSIPSPGAGTAEYGGNTPCLEVDAGGRRYVFDAGTGARPLGRRILQSGDALDATVFLTHFHWDHIQGFPFFEPLYRPEAHLRIVGPRQGALDVRSLFAGQMGPIYFPVPFSAVAATTTFEHLNEGSWSDDGVTVSAMRVRHPSFTVGYRIECGGHSLCFVPDNELAGEGYEVGPDWRTRLVRFLDGADVLIHDAMYTDEEYLRRRGWGHSTFRQCVDLALEAGVRRLLFFHHAPERTDAALDLQVEQAREDVVRRGRPLVVEGAREGPAIEV